MIETFMDFVLSMGLILSGFGIGFGARGIIEFNKNRNVKGYKSFWNKEKKQK